MHHRLPALCCALLCTIALALSVGTTATCQFFKVDYGGSSSGRSSTSSSTSSTSRTSRTGSTNSQHSPHDNYDNLPIQEESHLIISSSVLDRHYSEYGNYNYEYNDPFTTRTTPSTTQSRNHKSKNKNSSSYTYSDTHDIGLFCSSSVYAQSARDDIMWQTARGFQIASLLFVTFCTLAAWSSSIFKPTLTNWKFLSIISISSAGVEMPVFLFWACRVCQMGSSDGNGGGSQISCVVGKGFFMLLWSIILLCSVTVVTQLFNYPEYMYVLDEWRVNKSKENKEERRNFLTMLEERDDYVDRRRRRNHHGGIGFNDEDNDIDGNDGNDGNKNHDFHDGRECNEQLLEEGQVRRHDVLNTKDNIQNYERRRNQDLIFNEDDYVDEEEANVVEEIQRQSPHTKIRDSLKSLFVFGKHDNMKHEIFQEDSDYQSQSDAHYQNGTDGNNGKGNDVNCKEKQAMCNGSRTIDMRMIETKSDSSRLMIRGIGSNGKKIDDDRQSAHSFDLNLDDYDISHEMEDDDDDYDAIYDRLTRSSSLSPTSQMCQEEIREEQNKRYPDQLSPTNSCRDTNLESNDMNQNEDDKEDQGVIIFPAQFSPSNRAAAAQSPSGTRGRHSKRAITYPIQLLQNQVSPENVLYPIQQLRNEDSPKNENNDIISSIHTDEPEPEHDISIDDVHGRGPENGENVVLVPTGESQNVIIIDKEKQAISLSEYFRKAIQAGTSAAENSNNHEEEEPEPVYYSSSDSETSSISTTSQVSIDSLNLLLDGKQEGSYSDGDLPQTSQYLKKKLRRLRRKAERKKSKKKALKASRSVCSRISLMEMTIDEETDLDLELAEMSDDNETCQDSNYYNPLSRTEAETYLKSSPPAMDTPDAKKILNIVSPCSVAGNIFKDDDHDQNSTCREKIRKCMIPREIPMFSPSYSYDDENLSETESVSKSARMARRKRIKTQTQSKKLRLAKMKLTSIVRVNDSVENSYGSDEASC